MIDVNVFVRGMAWCDIGKPFFLGGERHSRLGYLWLDALGYPEEALVALMHNYGRLDAHLRRYWTFGGAVAEIPAILTLGNVVDIMTALALSLGRLSHAPVRGELRYSWQNPFSRLPQVSPIFGGPFDVTLHQMASGQVRSRLERYLIDWHDPGTERGLSEQTQKTLSQALRLASDDRRWQPVAPISPPEQCDLALQALLDCTMQHPQPFSPPCNDTTIMQYACLRNMLAFVLYRNLEKRDPSFLKQTVRLRENVVYLGNQPLRHFDGRSMVMQHLDGFLVRIALEGHRDLLADVACLDDLCGTHALAKLTLDAFIEAMADQLGVPDLAHFLIVAPTVFDVVYYLPACLGEEWIRQAISAAYDAALDRMTGKLIRDWETIFPRAKLLLDRFSHQDDLKRQFHSLVYGLQVLSVAVRDTKDFDDFGVHFAYQLMMAYINSLKATPFPINELPRIRNDLELSREGNCPVYDICDVCKTHPVYKYFSDLVADDEYLRKTIRHFRGETEQLCVSCITRRFLGYGAVQSRALNEMLRFDGYRTVVARRASGGPSLPPKLVRTAIFDSADDYLDIGVALVCQTRAHGQLLDVFPTVRYVADEADGVALLSLRSSRTIFEAYDYSKVIRMFETPDLRELGWAYEADQLREPFEKTFVDYYFQVRWEEPSLAEHVCVVRPHLTRMLARISQVSYFYGALQQRLEEHPIRVLPINAEYPTARLMVPADQIEVALRVLEQAVAEDLFSAPLSKANRAFLEYLVPPLLLVSVVIFNAKRPLYLVLETERALMRQLEYSPPNQYWGSLAIHRCQRRLLG